MEDVMQENLKILADNDSVIHDKLSALENSLKEVLTPKEVKEAEAKERSVTYKDLEESEGRTAKRTAELLEQQELRKANEREAGQFYDRVAQEAKTSLEAKGISWKYAEAAYDRVAKAALDTEVAISQKQQRDFNWKNVETLIKRELLEEAQETSEAKKEEFVKAKAPSSLSGINEGVSTDFIKSDRIKELTEAVASGKLSTEEQLKLYDQIQDYKHSMRKNKFG